MSIYGNELEIVNEEVKNNNPKDVLLKAFPRIIKEINKECKFKQDMEKEFKLIKSGSTKAFFDMDDYDIEDLSDDFKGFKVIPLISEKFGTDSDSFDLAFIFCDESQNARMLYTNCAKKYITEKLKPYKSYISKFNFGDGDEGCCYIYLK